MPDAAVVEHSDGRWAVVLSKAVVIDLRAHVDACQPLLVTGDIWADVAATYDTFHDDPDWIAAALHRRAVGEIVHGDGPWSITRHEHQIAAAVAPLVDSITRRFRRPL